MSEATFKRIEACYYSNQMIEQVINRIKVHGNMVACGIEDVDPVYQFAYYMLNQSNLIPNDKENKDG